MRPIRCIWQRTLAITISGRYNHAGIQKYRPPSRDRSRQLAVRSTETTHSIVSTPRPAWFTRQCVWRASISATARPIARRPRSNLGCADPTQPCNLPNALVADPPLKQVVARTFEAGIRSTGESKLKWSAGWFRAENTNDILFVASQQTGFGYFVNYGKTRRQGAEISLSGNYRWFTLGGNYTFLDATFQSAQMLGAASNSTNDGGLGLGRQHSGCFRATRSRRRRATCSRPTSISIRLRSFSVDLDFNAVGRSFARGNENNLDQPDGVYYLGPGFSPGYGVTNLGAHYQVVRHCSSSCRSIIMFNHRYYTAAQLNTTPFDNPGEFHSAAFRSRIPMPYATRLSFRPARREASSGE